jgi:AcrR family transcriptional regulator
MTEEQGAAAAPPSAPETSTRDRIFAAAVDEFAKHGNAGARVDRIAKNAKANKESIYRYYGTKEELLHRVVNQYLDEYGSRFEPQAKDLPTFIRDIFREHRLHPEYLRLTLWEGLEFGGELAPDTVEHRTRHFQEKIDSVLEQQRTGEVDPELDPRHLLLVLFGIANYWHALPQVVRMVLGREPTAEDLARHERVVEDCVRRILRPATRAD